MRLVDDGRRPHRQVREGSLVDILAYLGLFGMFWLVVVAWMLWYR